MNDDIEIGQTTFKSPIIDTYIQYVLFTCF